ncbi:MAG: hypothetical protein FWH11_05050 [Micrococcales bacterium]|nr:hypothetical protein [Micrococcales bacterium]
MTNRNIRWHASVAASLVLAATLAACSTSGQAGPTSSRFTGPWASDLEQMSNTFDSEFATQVFADSVITEQEMLEGKQLLQECYAAAGLEATWDEYGRVAVSGANPSDSAPPEAMGRCAFADGGVVVMYYQMLMNPQNEDDFALRASCLVQEGVVEPGFTGQDLQRLYDADETMPWPETDQAAQRCLLDPLGVGRSAGG